MSGGTGREGGKQKKQLVRGQGGGVKRFQRVGMTAGKQYWGCGEVGGRGEVLNQIPL